MAIVALAKDSYIGCVALKAELGIEFPLVADTSGRLIRNLGVLNSDDGLARPSVFVLGKGGQVFWSYSGVDASDRPSFQVVLSEARRLLSLYTEVGVK